MADRFCDYDEHMGWWWRADGDKFPYRTKKGVFSTSPTRIVGVDLRKAAAPLDLKVDGAMTLVIDGKSATSSVFEEMLTDRCPACQGTELALHESGDLPGPQVACSGCGGMYDLEAFQSAARYPLSCDWGARLEGRWSAGQEDAVIRHRPTLLSAKGAQAVKACVAIAAATAPRGLCPGPVGDDGVEALGDQPNIEYLRLWYSGIGDRGASLAARFQTLISLNVGNNKAVGDPACADIGKLPRLRSLNLEQTGVSDRAVAHLAALETLETLVLNATGITNEALASVAKMKGLKQLFLGSTKVTEAGLPLLAELPDLELVALWSTPAAERLGAHASRDDLRALAARL